MNQSISSETLRTQNCQAMCLETVVSIKLGDLLRLIKYSTSMTQLEGEKRMNSEKA